MNTQLANFKKSALALAVLPLMMTASGLSSAASVKGDGLTPSVAVVGNQSVPVGLLSFSINANTKAMPGTFSQQLIFSSPVSDLISGLNELSSTQAQVNCVSLDSNATTAWFAGFVTFQTPDFRINEATNQQIAALTNAGLYMSLGRIANGNPQTRSLFINSSTVPIVSLTDSNPNSPFGNISSTSINLTKTLNVNTFCRQQDQMLNGNADFLQLSTANGSPNCCTPDKPGCVITLTQKGVNATATLNGQKVPLCDIQYLAPDDTTPVGNPLPNVPSTFGPPNIPSASLYDNSGFTRTFQAGHVTISK